MRVGGTRVEVGGGDVGATVVGGALVRVGEIDVGFGG